MTAVIIITQKILDFYLVGFSLAKANALNVNLKTLSRIGALQDQRQHQNHRDKVLNEIKNS